jgi:hypothetical protein
VEVSNESSTVHWNRKILAELAGTGHTWNECRMLNSALNLQLLSLYCGLQPFSNRYALVGRSTAECTCRILLRTSVPFMACSRLTEAECVTTRLPRDRSFGWCSYLIVHDTLCSPERSRELPYLLQMPLLLILCPQKQLVLLSLACCDLLHKDVNFLVVRVSVILRNSSDQWHCSKATVNGEIP